MIAACSRVSAFSQSTQSDSVPKATPKGVAADGLAHACDEVVGTRYCTLAICGMPATSRKQLRVTQTVPQTDTGEPVEHTKALERTMLKELGKIAP